MAIGENRTPLELVGERPQLRFKFAYVKLDRLDLTKYKFCKNDPKTVILNNKCCCIPAENDIPTISLCRACTSNFDLLFQQERMKHISSYESVLKSETAKKEAAANELQAASDNWNEEKRKFIEIANQLDDLQDEWMKLVNTNFGLKKRVDMFHLKTIMHDHSYARIP